MKLRLRRTPAPPSGIGPNSIQIRPRCLHLADGFCATLVVTGFPREVAPGWLEPLLAYPGRLDVSVHIDPLPSLVAADRLRKQLARLESGLRSDQEHGRLLDPGTEAAAEDAQELASRIARGQAKLFRAAIYLTVHAGSEQELDDACAQVRALAASLLLDARVATFRQMQGWISSLPFAYDNVGTRRSFDTPALAAAFPFTSPDLTAELGPTAVLYGANTASSSLVAWDRFAQDNHNSVILARSGAGKSYLAKLEALRSLYTGVEVAVIDPEDEYARLCSAVGGAYIHLGAPKVRLNPFDLPPRSQRDSDPLTRRALFLHTLISLMLGEPLDKASKAALDRAIIAAYRRAGITFEPRTWNRRPPLMRDLVTALTDDVDPKAKDLAAGLAPYVLLRMAKAARKHWAGLSVVTQDAGDLLSSEIGQAIIANSTTQILLKQAPQAIDKVVDAFQLSEGERQLLLSAERGTGLLTAGAGAQRVPLQVIASQREHDLVTSSPQELSRIDYYEENYL